MGTQNISAFTQTWNNGGTTYNAIKVNVTNSASAADSKLIALQIGGSNYFYVDKNGNAVLTGYGTDAAVGPSLSLHRDSSSPADDDILGEIKFDGEDDGSNQTTYARIYGQAKDVTDATEDGALFGQVMIGGTLTTVWSATTAGFVVNSGGVHLPEGSAPTTSASEGAIYTKDSGTQPELFFREESDGDEVQITRNGALSGNVAFPATQNASADANTLDDYEEGSFTATLTCGTSGSITLSGATIYYTKVGRAVHFAGLLTVGSVSSPVGSLTMGTLPFASISNGYSAVALRIADFTGSSGITWQAFVGSAATTVIIDYYAAATGTVGTSAADLMKAGTTIVVDGTYFTS